MSDPYISIIILTCNQCITTFNCLNALYPFPEDFEIIIVDNGSIDSTAEMISQHFPEVKYIRHYKNLGVSYGRNAGISQSTGQYLMLLDNDTVPSVDAIRSLAYYLNTNKNCAIAAPRLVDSKGLTQRSFREFPGILEKMRSILKISSDIVSKTEVPIKPIHPFYVLGAAQMIRRTVFEKIGPFDNRIFYGPDDADICIRVRLSAAGEITYLPDIVIYHYWRRASRRFFSKLWYKHISSLFHFYITHRRFL